MTTLTADDLAAISRSTVGHYDARADDFWEGTRDHDVSQNLDALLAALDASRPLDLLDFGCGPGRDLVALTQRVHRPTGLDGSATFCAMARKRSGCPVLHQDFVALDLPAEAYDGVFANASLFHVPSQHLPVVLSQLCTALRPGGALFSSVPRGDGVEGWNGARYGTYLQLPAWRALFEGAGFAYLDHYYRPPGLPRDQQPWLASTWRRPLREAGRD